MVGRKALHDALIKKGIGQVLSREISIEQGAEETRGADAVGGVSGRPQVTYRLGEIRVSPARSETLCMYRSNSRENRELPWLSEALVGPDRVGKSKDNRR